MAKCTKRFRQICESGRF